MKSIINILFVQFAWLKVRLNSLLLMSIFSRIFNEVDPLSTSRFDIINVIRPSGALSKIIPLSLTIYLSVESKNLLRTSRSNHFKTINELLY